MSALYLSPAAFVNSRSARFTTALTPPSVTGHPRTRTFFLRFVFGLAFLLLLGLEAGAATFDLTGASGGSTQTVQQTVGADTMVLTTTDDVMVVDSDTNVWGGGINDTSGTVMAVASGVGYESKLRITVSGGKVFDLDSFTLVDIAGENKDLTITTNKGSSTFTSNFSSLSWAVSLAAATFQGITYADITTNHVSNHFAWGFDNFVLNNIAAAPPTVTDARISITSTGSGTGGAYKIGDTVTASWNNTAGGDNNTGLTGVTMDFSQFGGGSSVVATNSSGTWTASYTLVAGTIDTTNRNVSVSATSPSGTTTTADTTNATVDNIAPTVTDAKISISGASGTGGVYKIGDTVTATWNNTAGGDNNSDTISTVRVDFSQFGGGAAVNASNSSGTWTATYTLLAGALEAANRNVSFTATDNAGNGKTTADTTNATIDNLAPSIPSTPDLVNTTDSGVSSSDNLTNRTTPNFKGTADANSTVTLYDTDGTTVLGTTTANGSGNWLITSSLLSEGVHTIKAKAADAAGNLSGLSSGLNVTIDTIAPTTEPNALTLDSGTDSGLSNADGITNVSGPCFNGTGANANSWIWVYADGTILGTTLSDGSGNFSYSATYFPDGAHLISARNVDNAGNIGPDSTSLPFTIDTQTPTATIATMAFSADTGASSTDFITKTAAQTISGTTSANLDTNDIVEVSLDNGGSWTMATASAGSNTWSLSGQTLAGSDTLKVRVSDLAGNAGSEVAQAYVLDTTGPTTTIATVSFSADTGTSSTDFITKTAAQTISGTTSANLVSGESVEVSLDNGSTWTTASTSVGTNTWSLAGQTLSASSTLKARVTDNAGNFSTVTSQAYILDTTSPFISNTGLPADGTYVAGQNLDFTATFSEATTVTGTPRLPVTLDTGGTVYATYLSGSGTTTLTFRYTVTAGDADGDGISVGSTLQLNGGTLRDNAGNNATLTLNGVGSATGVLVDTIAPSVSFINRQTPAGATTNATSATYRVTFSEGVSGVDASDFVLTATTVNGTIAGVSPLSASVYDVTVNSISGSGTLRLDLKASGTGIADLPGNAITAGFTSGQTYTFDTDAPTLSSLGLPANGTRVAGQSLDFTATFSEAVTATGTPRLPITLDTGGTVYADYLSGSGTSALVFRYTVATGDLDLTGITLGSALLLNGGTLRDSTGNDATLTVSAGSTAGILVDAVAPTVASVSVPANGTHKAGDPLDFTANFSEAVTVAGGTPSIDLTLDTGGIVHATYLSGSGTSALVFRYTIVSGDADATGVSLASQILLNGASLRDAAGNDSVSTLNSVGSTAGVLVDGIAPAVSSIVRVSGATSNSSSVDYTVTFSEAVTGVDSTDFTLTPTGTAGGTIASIATVSNTTYTVTLSSVSGTGTLRLDLKSSGTGITDLPGNAIAAGFSAGEVYSIDTQSPTISSVAVPANGSYSVGQNLDFTVSFSEAATVTGAPALPITLDTGGTVSASYISGSGTAALVFRYTVVTGNQDANGITVGSALQLSGGTIRDAATNDVVLTLNAVGNTSGVLVDAVDPTVASVSVPANRTSKAGDHLDFTVNFSEAVTVASGTPYLPVTLDTGGTVHAAYLSGSGTSALVFRYTVAAGDLDTDGVALGSAIALNGSTLKDAAGNDSATTLSNVGATTGVLVDGVAPTVASIVRVNAASTNSPSLDYTVTFSEAVTGVSTTDFTLTTSATATATIASIATVSTTTYTVTLSSVSGDGTLRLDLKSSGTGITDTPGNAIATGFTAGEVYTLDHSAPAVVSVAVPANGTYATGQNLDFTVNFSEAVTVDTTGGTPSVPITLNTGGTVQAAYRSGSGTTALVFRYTVVSGDLDTDGVTVGASMNRNSGTLRDAVGNDIGLALNSVASTSGVLVDAVAPTVSSVTAPANGTYATGANLNFTVTYSEAVTVDTTGGTPVLPILLTTGGPASAAYLSGSGSSTLTFRYTVAAGQEDTDGIAVTPGIVLNGGTIKDSGGNDAVLTTSAFTTTGVLVDGLAPTVSTIARQTPSSSSTSANSVILRVTFSEKVTGVDSGDFTLTTTGTAAGTIGAVSSVSQNVYDVTVGSLVKGGTIRLDLKANATVSDLAENAATAAFTGGETFTLVNNRPPSFTAGSDVSAAQDAGPTSIPAWATEISAGSEDESDQVLNFIVTADHPELFTTAPAIAPDGTLTFTPAPTANGSATITVVLHDNGGAEGEGGASTDPITFQITFTTYDEENGTYNGLVQTAPDATPGNDKTGLVHVVVGKKGVFTGYLKIAGQSASFKGSFDKAGVATFGKPAIPTLLVPRKKLTPLTLALKLDVGGNTGKLTGTLEDAGAAFALIEADRAIYTAAKKPVAPQINVPAGLLGRYTVVLGAKTPHGQSLPAASYPQGDGVAIISVTTSGVVRLTGTLADGTAISCSNTLSKDNVWAFYAPFFGGLGSVSASVHFRDQPNVSDLDALDATWFKPVTKGKYYPAGWTSGIKVDFLGSKFLPVNAASVFFGSVQPGDAGDASITLTEGGFPDPITKALNISPKNLVKVIDAGTSKLNLKLLSGRISGDLIDPATGKKAMVSGVIFQKQKTGFGFFLGASEGGAVTLEPHMPPQ